MKAFLILFVRVLRQAHLSHDVCRRKFIVAIIGCLSLVSCADKSSPSPPSTSEKILGRTHPSSLTSANNLALVLEDRDKYEEAEQLFRKVLKSREKILGSDHPDTLISINNLAVLRKHQGNREEAEQLYRRALLTRASDFCPKMEKT